MINIPEEEIFDGAEVNWLIDRGDEEIAKGIYNDISVEIKTATAKEWFI